MQFIKNPNEELKSMLAHAVHFGHYTNKWNPKMKKFIYTSRKGVHIFDLHKTLVHLDKAMAYLAELKQKNKTILFVSTKQQATPVLTATAATIKMPYVTSKWIPGLLTNFDTVGKRIAELKKLRKMRDEGELVKYTKKEISKIEKEIIKLENALGGVENLERAPDALFVVDTVRDAIAVKEARKLGIPVIAIIDTNSDPDLVDFPIPGNDDAIKSLTYFMGQVEKALSA